MIDFILLGCGGIQYKKKFHVNGASFYFQVLAAYNKGTQISDIQFEIKDKLCSYRFSFVPLHNN